MHQVSFGNVLKEARIAKGLDLAQVARELRIRQDIIRAIEAGDFERIPARGYARNMIAAYARLVGLNTQEVCRMYLDQEYAYQIARAHRSVDSQVQMHDSVYRSASGRGQTGSFSRVQSQTGGQDLRMGMGYGSYPGSSLRDQQSAHRARRSAVTDGKYTNLYTQPRGFTNPNQTRNRVIAVVAAVVVAIAIIALVLLSHQPAQQTTIPVTGAQTSSAQEQTQTETETQSEPETAVQETAPTQFTFAYTVDEGASTYIEVYVDDVIQEAADVEGPATSTYDVTGKIRFVTTETEGVSASVDGEAVELSPSSSGIVNQTFTLEEVVAEWNQEHSAS